MLVYSAFRATGPKLYPTATILIFSSAGLVVRLESALPYTTPKDKSLVAAKVKLAALPLISSSELVAADFAPPSDFL